MKTSKITYLNNLRTEAVHLRSGEKIITDAPIDNNGKGEAFSPTDLAASSLGSCAITIMGISGQKEDLIFDGTEIEITKIMTENAPRKIAKIVVEFLMKTNKILTTEQQEKYEKIAHRCPVSLSLHPEIIQEFIFKW